MYFLIPLGSAQKCANKWTVNIGEFFVQKNKFFSVLLMCIQSVQWQWNNSGCNFTARWNDALHTPKTCCDAYSVILKTRETRINNYKSRPSISACFRKTKTQKNYWRFFNVILNWNSAVVAHFYSTVKQLQQANEACWKQFLACFKINPQIVYSYIILRWNLFHGFQNRGGVFGETVATRP